MDSNTTFNKTATSVWPPVCTTQVYSVMEANDSDFNSTAPYTEVEQGLHFWILKIVCYCIILLGSSVGNSLVIYIIASNVRMRTPSNLLIMNLAVCDFVTPVFSIPFDFALEEYKYIWIYGASMCKILWPLTTLSSTSAALTLAAIALDRYRVIMHPFKPRLTMVKIKCIIVAIYVFSLLMVTPYSYVLSMKESECRETWPDISYKKYYTLGLFMVQYLLPLTFMVVMYSLALKNLYTTTDKTSSRKAEKEKASLNSASASPSTSAEPKLRKVSSTVRLVRKLSSTIRKGTNEANKRATKMFLAIVVVFTICMFPNQALWLWADFSNGGDSPMFLKAVIICWLFTYSNSVCNPVIYAVFSRDFRRGFKRAFRKAFCLRHRRRNVLNPDLVATLTTELKSAATDIERRKRKNATVEPPKLYLL
ncbi:hypothetical protein ACROYT_G033820 [Oculina patagonica]